jgi:hypothetical protein
MSIEFKDHSPAVKALLQANLLRALTAMGQIGVEITTDTMNTGYGKPIYLTGDLQRDVNFEVDAVAQAVKIGNSLPYAAFVHEGTSKMAGRPYLRDGVLSHKSELQDVAAEEIKKGF